MSKLLLPSFFLALSLLSISPVSAQQQTTPQTTHTQVKTALQTARQDYKVAAQTAHDAFEQKLAQIKDTRKQAIVSKIDTRIQEINTKRTMEMTNSLEKLSAILDRVASKTATVTPAPSQNFITAARTKIATAQTAVTDQQAKHYIITITTDASLGQAVSATLTTFTTDIKATHQTVLDAKSAVITAIEALEPQTVEATPTITTTP